jgi:hypothetical protein
MDRLGLISSFGLWKGIVQARPSLGSGVKVIELVAINYDFVIKKKYGYNCSVRHYKCRITFAEPPQIRQSIAINKQADP